MQSNDCNMETAVRKMFFFLFLLKVEEEEVAQKTKQRTKYTMSEKAFISADLLSAQTPNLFKEKKKKKN